ncbi:MAG: hypothetical protein Q4D06_04025 [Coriobacteriia bacterium]|nr:hypothetical protein [Coriobacteriia bacterium]
MTILIRLIQSLPLMLALAVLAVAVYVFVSWRQSPNRAKEILVKLFTVLTTALCVLFVLACAYAAIEGNQAVLEFFGAFLAVSAAALGITLICRARFRKNHPNYAEEPVWARTISRPEALLRKVLEALTRGPYDPRNRR